MRKYRIVSVLLAAGLLAGCAAAEQKTAESTWHAISQDEAKRMMEQEKGFLIVDVRTAEEFAEGHIPGAVNVPNESISENSMPQELPDKDQILLIYCRSGNRSRQAAEKLAKTGYTNLYEFGGINTWSGEITTE